MVTQVGPVATRLFAASSGKGRFESKLLCGYEHFTTFTTYFTSAEESKRHIQVIHAVEILCSSGEHKYMFLWSIA